MARPGLVEHESQKRRPDRRRLVLLERRVLVSGLGLRSDRGLLPVRRPHLRRQKRQTVRPNRGRCSGRFTGEGPLQGRSRRSRRPADPGSAGRLSDRFRPPAHRRHRPTDAGIARHGLSATVRARSGALQTAVFLLPTSYFLLPTSYFLLPTSYFLLPTSYFLLPTSYFLLPTSYFLLRLSITAAR